MAFASKGGFDIEAQNGYLYPGMMENPELRWGFIRKVYVILCFQLLLTIAVASVVVFVEPISDFVLHTPAGLALYILVVVLTFISMFSNPRILSRFIDFIHTIDNRYVYMCLCFQFCIFVSIACGLYTYICVDYDNLLMLL